MKKETEHRVERRNRAKCALCEEIIESKYRHDFVSCKCGSIFVDGGRDYCRMGGNMENIIIVHDDDSEESLLELNQQNTNEELLVEERLSAIEEKLDDIYIHLEQHAAIFHTLMEIRRK